MKHLALVLGMMAVTYVPRMVPFLLLRDLKLPVFVRRFLRVLPACALGALLVPDVITSIPGSPLAALVGAAISGAVSLTKGGLLLSVIAGVGAAYVLLLLGL
jgi:branched-subunit amino acid transport protein